MQLTNEQKLNLLPEGAYFGDPITGAMLDHIIAALRTQADARPVAWIHDEGGPTETVHAENHGWEGKWTPLYTHPEASAPGLSDETLNQLIELGAEALAAHHKSQSDDGHAGTEAWERWHGLREQMRAILTRASAATATETSEEAASYKRMFEDAVISLAAIDDALGIDPDESGGAAPILEAIAALKKQAAVATATLPDELKWVPETIKEGGGIWRTCTGCYESEDGHAVGNYPYSRALDCTLGGGCSECGGIGAVWDTTDYNAMAAHAINWDEAEEAAQQAEPVRGERAANPIDAGIAYADWKASKDFIPYNKPGFDAGFAAGQRAGEETQALRDMLGDARAELESIRKALGVPYEPHQSLMERTLEAAEKAGQRAGVAIPDGWQVVPKIPTREMCQAAAGMYAIHATDDLHLHKAGWSMHAIMNGKRWVAMLAASTQQQAEPGADERAAFEAWADANGWFMERADDGYYRSKEVECMFMGWQARAAQSGQRAGVAEVVLDYLKAHAVPSYQVKVTTNPESASLCQQQIVTVDCGSWGNLIEHIQRAAAPTQQQERRE